MGGNVGRNDPCPCGSGVKFKRCCIAKSAPDLPKEIKPEYSVPPQAISLADDPHRDHPLAGFRAGGIFLEKCFVYHINTSRNSNAKHQAVASQQLADAGLRLFGVRHQALSSSMSVFNLPVPTLEWLEHQQASLKAEPHSYSPAMGEAFALLKKAKVSFFVYTPAPKSTCEGTWSQVLAEMPSSWKVHGQFGFMTMFQGNHHLAFGKDANAQEKKVGLFANSMLRAPLPRNFTPTFEKLAGVVEPGSMPLLFAFGMDLFFPVGFSVLLQALNPVLSASRMFPWTSATGHISDQLRCLTDLIQDPFGRLWICKFDRYDSEKAFELNQLAVKTLLLKRGLRNSRLNYLKIFAEHMRENSRLFLNLENHLRKEWEDGSLYQPLNQLFFNMWDVLSFASGHSCPTAAELKQQMGLVALAKKRDKATNSEKPNFKRQSWRLERSGMESSGVSDVALVRLQEHLVQHARHELAQRGLSQLQPPLVEFRRGSLHPQVHYALDTQSLILHVTLVEQPISVLFGFVNWALAHQLYQDYRRLHGREKDDFANENKAWEMAIKRMGLELRFRNKNLDYAEIPLDWVASKDCLTEEEQRFFDKVDKLFNLSRSSNEHEAALAAQRAQELLNSRNRERHRTGASKGDMIKITILLPNDRQSHLYHEIVSLLTDHFFVRVVWSQDFNVETGETRKTFEMMGRKENVLLAEHAFDFLADQSQRLWESKKKESKLPASAKLSYKVGIVRGFHSKLSEQRKRQEEAAQNAKGEFQGLIALENKDLQDFVSELFPKLSSSTSKGFARNEDVFREGQAEGKNITIHTPVGERNKPKSERQFLS
jgi:hypothetical protein